MLFTSIEFIILFLSTFLLYYLPVLKKEQVRILIIASLVFYAFNNLSLLLLLLFCVMLNTSVSYIAIHSENVKRIKLVTTIGVLINLLVLAFFKYSSLFAVSFFPEGATITEMLIAIPLPVGISFYTFEGISLMVDAFRDETFKHRKVVVSSFRIHFENTIFFISFFPHLIAGPVIKAHDFFPQIMNKSFSDINWEKCFKYLVLGYFLKMVVADNLKDFTFWMEYPYFLNFKSLDLWVMLFGYSMQIFADFAGYSLIALGLAKLFGYDLIQNFRFPYFATSFKDFWKKWHISLSTFLMEYLYIPMGGSKKGKMRTYFNLLITMVLGGLWHGAAWSYALWGAFHGLCLVIERYIANTFKLRTIKPINYFYAFIVFVFVTFGWLLFKLPDFNDVKSYVTAMFSLNSFSFSKNIAYHIFIYSLPVVIYHIASKYKSIFMKFDYVFYACMLFLIITNAGSGKAFIYFQF